MKAAFDTEGFRARVQDNAQMPSMALKRKLQGDVTVQVTLDTMVVLLDKVSYILQMKYSMMRQCLP